MSHPFLTKTLHIRWSTLTPDAVEPDITLALEKAQQALDKVMVQDRGKMSFASVILGFEESLRELNQAWGLVNHLDAVCNTPALREAYNKMLPAVTAFLAKVPLDENLWDLILTYSKTDEGKALTGTQRRALDETLAWFRELGAELPPNKKKRLEEIEGELSLVTQKYSENVLDSTNAWEMVVEDISLLAGLPVSAIEAAKADAEAKGLGAPEKPVYRFTLKAPSMIPAMEHLEDTELRKRIWEGSTTVGRGDKYDNTELVWRILALRHEKAQILGKPNFADYVLERRMARNGATALKFTETLHDKIRTAFNGEIAALQEYVGESSGQPTRLLEPWEVAYWSERRRRAKYDFDQEELRPYFPVDGVLGGMFRIAERLFDLQITQRDTVFYELGQTGESSASTLDPGPVEVWHPLVKFYEVRNADGIHIGSFFADWHPRDSKRGGAWMNYLQGGLPPTSDQARRPHLGLICGNMSPPVGDKQALLTHDEVCTVFHEFGHLLHQILGNVDVPSLNGLNVAWDFVELPSQLMENFCWERESLDFFAIHHENTNHIPEALFKKMIESKNYMSAVSTMRQLGFGKLDLELHMYYAEEKEADLDALSRKVLQEYTFPTQTLGPAMARRFGHLFSQSVGYAAGYYSYKWAEVLDADAFTRFQQEGVLNPIVGRALRDCILSKGNSEEPGKLFRDFMGRDPDPSALLLRAGLA